MCTLPTRIIVRFSALLALVLNGPSALGTARPSHPRQDADTAWIAGRVVLQNGKPAAGAAVRFNTWHPDNMRETTLGLPDYEGEPSTTADDHGDFRLQVTPSDGAALGYTLDVSLPGHTTLSWQFSELDTTEPLDLGKLQLEESGRVVVRLLEVDGTPSRRTFSVAAMSGNQYEHGGMNMVRSESDPATGLATLDGLAEGLVEVGLMSGSGAKRLRTTALVVAGESTQIECQLTGPDPSRTIVLDLESNPYPFISWKVEGVALLAPDGTRVEADEHRHSEWTFQDLEADEYTLLIDDPRFERIERPGLKPGKRAMAWVRPSSGVELELMDAASGAEIDRFELTVRLDEDRSSLNTFRLQSPRRRPPEDGYFPIPAEACSLLIDVDGYGLTTVPIDALAVAERRTVRVELQRAVTVRGRVVQHDGETPVGESFVFLRRPGDPISFYRPTGITIPPQTPPLLALRADRAGRFEFDCAPGEYALHVVHDAWNRSTVDPLVIQPGHAEEIVVPLQATWTLHGVLSGGNLDSLMGMRVQPVPQSDRLDWQLLSCNRSVPIAADGSFRIDMLPPGEVKLLLVMPEVLEDETEPEPGFYFPDSITEIGSIEGAAGAELRHDFEIADRWPSSVAAHVVVDGGPAEGYQVLLLSTEKSHKRSELRLDAQGRGTVHCVEPGEYRVVIVSGLGLGRKAPARWSVALPEPIRLAAGERRQLEHSLSLTTARVQVIDARTQEPLAGWHLMLKREGGADPVGPTDDDGWFEITLPAGEFHFERARGVPDRGHPLWFGTLSWTGAGAGTAQLRMQRH